MKYDKKNWVVGKFLNEDWNKKRYLEFKKAYNHAVYNGEDVFVFEKQAIITRFAYGLLRNLQRKFEN